MSTFYGDFATHAARQDSGIQPVLEITLLQATWNGGVNLNLSGGVALARGTSYDPRVAEGGWGDIKRYFDVLGSNLAQLETSVQVADPDRAVQTALEAGQQRGSVARIYWVIPGNSTDYSLRFTGVLESWEYQPGSTTLKLRTDDSFLRGYLPNWQLTKSEWPDMPAISVGTQVPLIYGTHDSTGLSSTGMVNCFPVWEQAEVGIWWHVVCLGQAKEVRDVYVDGTIKTEGIGSDYVVSYLYERAGKAYTMIVWVSAVAPGSVVTADVSGYDTTGNTATVNPGFSNNPPTGPLIINPVEQMRHLLVNHAEAHYKSGAWDLTAGDVIDAQSWAEAAQWAERRGLEGAGYVGGKTERRLVRDIFDEWLDSWPCFRASWNAEGKLSLRVIDLEFPGYRATTDPPLMLTSDEVGDSFSYSMDTTDLTDSLSGEYLYGQAEEKFWASLTVTDPDLGEGISSSKQMPWSIARAT